MNICIFGDSLTWGAFLPFRAGWANLLRNYLESKNDRTALYDLGIDGNTTRDVLARFDAEAKARTPQIIMFAVGTNDSLYRKTEDNHEVPLEEFKNNVQQLLDKALALTPKIFFVGLVKGDDSITTPLSRSTTDKCYTKKWIKVYSDAVKGICKERGVEFVEVYDLLKDEDFDDGLHPNIGGHVKIFEAVRRLF